MSILSSNGASVYSDPREWIEQYLPHLKEGENCTFTKTLPIKVIVTRKHVVLCNYPEKRLEVNINGRMQGVIERIDDGNFICSHSQLTSLVGAPEKVASFDCSFCKYLTSLEGAPQEVNGDFCAIGCGRKFTEEEIRKGRQITGKVYC